MKNTKMQKVQNYINTITDIKKQSMQKYLDASNTWLSENRPKAKPIKLIEVAARLLNSSSLLSIEADAKTQKGSKNGYLTGILYLAPYNICGVNLCPMAITCTKDCLFNSGRGRFASVSRARIIKTLAFLLDRDLFEKHLAKDIKLLEKKAIKAGMVPVVRLNGTSDLQIEKTFKNLLVEFSNIQFYDYTKIPTRFKKQLPSNYDLTFSFDGVNWQACLDVLASGGRVAVVFKNGLPASFDGYQVINGDDSDLRFLDGNGIIIGLNAKGSAKSDLADDRFIIDSKTDIRCNSAIKKAS